MILNKLSIKNLDWKHPLIKDALEKNHLASGPHVALFEGKLSQAFGFDHCITLTNGYSALFVALKSLSIQAQQVVVPAASTCLAMTNAVLATGNTPIFCPLDPDTFSFDLDELKEILKKNSVAALIVPSHFGVCAPIEKIKSFTDIPVIEDACQAFLSRSLQKSKADMVVLSFYPTKMFNCIDGGCLLTNDDRIAKKSKELRYYDDQIQPGSTARYNLKMNNLNCAFGLVQFEKLPGLVSRLKEVKGFFLNTSQSLSGFLCSAQLEDNGIPWRLMISLENEDWYEGIRKLGVPIDREIISASIDELYTAQKHLNRNHYSIPFHQDLTREAVNFISSTVNKVLN